MKTYRVNPVNKRALDFWQCDICNSIYHTDTALACPLCFENGEELSCFMEDITEILKNLGFKEGVDFQFHFEGNCI